MEEFGPQWGVRVSDAPLRSANGEGLGGAGGLRARLYQASVSMLMTLAILLSLKTRVTPEWVCNPFSINSTVFNENRIASVITVLRLTLGVNGL